MTNSGRSSSRNSGNKTYKKKNYSSRPPSSVTTKRSIQNTSTNTVARTLNPETSRTPRPNPQPASYTPNTSAYSQQRPTGTLTNSRITPTLQKTRATQTTTQTYSHQTSTLPSVRYKLSNYQNHANVGVTSSIPAQMDSRQAASGGGNLRREYHPPQQAIHPSQAENINGPGPSNDNSRHRKRQLGLRISEEERRHWRNDAPPP